MDVTLFGKVVALSRTPEPCRGSRSAIAREARTWILAGGPDFIEVCALAGLDPGVVRDELRRRLADPARARMLRNTLRGNPTGPRSRHEAGDEAVRFAYWQGCNFPVIVVLVHLERREAYRMSVEKVDQERWRSRLDVLAGA